MGKFLVFGVLLCTISVYAEAKYTYSDYAELRSDFDGYLTSINEIIEKTNKNYIVALNSYQQCSSDSWRATFATVVKDIDERRSALDTYKQDAYGRAGSQNDKMYKEAQDRNINNVKPDEDISEYVIWYKNHISFMKSGPLHELLLYAEGYRKLTEIYEIMAKSCKENDVSMAKNFDLVSSGIRGLLDGVFYLIGRK